MSPKRGRIRIVQIGNGYAQLARQTLANIKSRPIEMNKVCGAARTELASRASRTRSIQANSHHIRELDTRSPCGDLETICYLLEADRWSLLGKRRMLAQALD